MLCDTWHRWVSMLLQSAVILLGFGTSGLKGMDPRGSDDRKKEAVDRLERAVDHFVGANAGFPKSDEEVAKSKAAFRAIVKIAVETRQESRAANRLSEALCEGGVFRGSDYYTMWLAGFPGDTCVDKTVINALIRKMEARRKLALPEDVVEEMCTHAGKLISDVVESDIIFLKPDGFVDWKKWDEFTQWWRENRHVLIHDPMTKKLRPPP